MKNNEELEKEMEVQEGVAVEETAISVVQNFGALNRTTSTKTNIYTNITDEKKLFNLENKVDELLNNCENELIRVEGVLIKRYEKLMKNPEINEETGEIIKDKEITMSCVLVDDNGKSYATGSKMFTIQMMRYLQQYNSNVNPFEIKITKKKINNGNALGFELV